MKTTLEYTDDERHEANCAYHGSALWSALWEIDNQCRSRMKHGEDVSDAEYSFLESIRDAASIARSIEEL